jgi:hypothetical protein
VEYRVQYIGFFTSETREHSCTQDRYESRRSVVIAIRRDSESIRSHLRRTLKRQVRNEVRKGEVRKVVIEGILRLELLIEQAIHPQSIQQEIPT